MECICAACECVYVCAAALFVQKFINCFYFFSVLAFLLFVFGINVFGLSFSEINKRKSATTDWHQRIY